MRQNAPVVCEAAVVKTLKRSPKQRKPYTRSTADHPRIRFMPGNGFTCCERSHTAKTLTFAVKPANTKPKIPVYYPFLS